MSKYVNLTLIMSKLHKNPSKSQTIQSMIIARNHFLSDQLNKAFILSKQGFVIKRIALENQLTQMLTPKPQTDYIRQLQKEGSIKTHFEKQQQLYTADINMAIYMDLTDIEKLHIFDIVTVNHKQDFVVNLYGCKMRIDDHMSQKFYKLFIRQMDSLLRNQTNRKYYVVFFDSSSEKKNSSDIFKEMFKRLPAIYFVKLNKIFHVNPDFLTRTIAQINIISWSKFFHKHVQYIDSVQNVQQISQLKIFNILVKCPKQITKGIKVLSQTPNMVRSAMLGSKKPKPFDCLKRQLKDYHIDQEKNVPQILTILIQTMKQCRQLCLKEGIFRVAGSIEDEEELLKEIIDHKTFHLVDSNTHCKRAIAGLMKKIFTESTTPLIPYQIYNHILNQKIDQTNIMEYWQLILIELPALNKRILCYVTEFLREFILKNKDQNKMNSHNLAVVFNPCFFRAKECCIADLMNSGKFAALFKWWLQNYEKVVNSTDTPGEIQKEVENQQNQSSNQRNRKYVTKIQYEGGLPILHREILSE